MIFTDSQSMSELCLFADSINCLGDESVKIYPNLSLADYLSALRKCHFFLGTFPFVASTSTAVDFIKSGVLSGWISASSTCLRGRNRVFDELDLDLYSGSAKDLASVLNRDVIASNAMKNLQKLEEFFYSLR